MQFHIKSPGRGDRKKHPTLIILSPHPGLNFFYRFNPRFHRGLLSPAAPQLQNSIGLLRGKFFQADLVGDVIELLAADGFELFAARLELLVYLDGLFGHLLVGILGAADEREIIAGGNALMPVGIQADAEQRRLAFNFFGVGHVEI